jgi:hypothetical protein
MDANINLIKITNNTQSAKTIHNNGFLQEISKATRLEMTLTLLLTISMPQF